jgi:diguanylate cyclase (GGDEF)-like protein
MKLGLDPRTRAPRGLAIRAMGVLGLAGGLLAAATAILPPAAEGSDTLIVAIGGVSAVMGGFLLLRRPGLGQVGLGVLTLFGTLLITVSTHEGGPAGGTADNEILYLWITLYAFYFLSLPHALAQLGLVGVAYGWLVADFAPAEQATTQWLVTMSTLLVAGLVIAALRANLYRHVSELSERASRDELTGLLNRGSLDDRFELEQARSLRERTPISLLVVDIDEFKALNDTLGHPTGDKVLRQVASALQHWTRAIDAAARLGGDEFAVLLSGTSAADALQVAEDLGAAISRSPAIRDVRVTVSIGVTSSEHPSPGFGELWQAADAAMYEAKRSGGDGVRFRDPGASEPTAPDVIPTGEAPAHP